MTAWRRAASPPLLGIIIIVGRIKLSAHLKAEVYKAVSSHNEHGNLQPVPNRGDRGPEENIAESSVSLSPMTSRSIFCSSASRISSCTTSSISQEDFHFNPPVVKRRCQHLEILFIVSGLGIERIGAEERSASSFHHVK